MFRSLHDHRARIGHLTTFVTVVCWLTACADPSTAVAPRVPRLSPPHGGVAVTGADFDVIGVNVLGALGSLGGINDAGHVAGSEYSGQGYSGLFWTDPNVLPLNFLPCCGIVATINNADQAVGWSTVPFVWSTAAGLVYPPLLPGHAFGQAQAVNNVGAIAGNSGPNPNSPNAALWVPTVPNGATFTTVALGTLPGDVASIAYGINDAGQIVGQSSNSVGESRAVLWQPTAPGANTFTVVSLGTLGGTQGSAWGINANGVIVGKSLTSSGAEEAFMWTPTSPGATTGSLQSLGPGWARSVSDNGIVVGDGTNGWDGWVWTSATGRTDLPVLVGSIGRPEGINRIGNAIAGSYRVPSAGTQYPVIWRLHNSAPLVVAGGPYVGAEGSPITFDGTGSSDPDGDALTYEWDFGDGSPHAATAIASHTYADNSSYVATLTVRDGQVASQPTTAPVTVSNVAPSLQPFTPSVLGPAPVGTQIPVTATFSDPGKPDTHTAVVDWDDSAGLEPIAGFGTIAEDHTNGGGSLTITRAYARAGVYTVRLRVADNAGALSTIVTAGVGAITQYVVIYDPSGGFVTGGGWIDSPAGAVSANPIQAGKATFGFVAKYQKGATKPDGNTEFDFRIADLNFRSSSYDWLVVSGPLAQYKGTGTINGEGAYQFLVTARDGDFAGGQPDKFRIKIWNAASGATIYDNGLGASTDIGATSTAATGSVLGSGSITIHPR